MNSEKKIKLFYSGELILIAIVFVVIAILQMTKVMTLSERFILIFKIVTLAGATWLTFDFIWTMVSEKKRAKSSLIDKTIILPLALYLYIFDIIGLATKQPYDYYRFGLPAAFLFIATVYTFEGIYHYYRPIPAILEAIEEDRQEALKKQQEENKPQDIQEEEK